MTSTLLFVKLRYHLKPFTR